jgi:ankyrin repeat protein
MQEKTDNSKNHSEKYDSTLGYDPLLHGVSDEIAMVHVAGIHLPKQFKVIGMGAGAAAETLHHSTGHLAEDIVCNAGVGLLKEFIDVSVARTLAGTVGASFSAVPMIAIPTTTALAIAAYRGMQKITEPAANTLRDICHKTFESLRETKVVENLNDLDEFIRGVRYLTSEYKWPNGHDLLLKPNVKDSRGNTPLHYAIEKNQVGIVKLLVEAEANLTTPNQDGYLPLNLAVMYSNAEMVSYLLSKGAPIESKRVSSGVTALQQAPVYGKTAILKVLISKGANVNTADKYGNTVLHYAIEKNSLTDVKAIVEAGANLTTPNQDGYLPLNLAVMYSNAEMVSYLLSKGAPIESKRVSSGVTALQQAPVYGKTDILKLLISKGADVNAADKYGNTALHYAIEKNRLDDVNLLVVAGGKQRQGNHIDSVIVNPKSEMTKFKPSTTKTQQHNNDLELFNRKKMNDSIADGINRHGSANDRLKNIENTNRIMHNNYTPTFFSSTMSHRDKTNDYGFNLTSQIIAQQQRDRAQVRNFVPTPSTKPRQNETGATTWRIIGYF